MIRNIHIIILVILIGFSVFSFTISASINCSCENDRRLELQYPIMKGDDVEILQKRLKEYGFYSGPVDGKYGKKTAKAVEDFQKEYGLKSTGVVGQGTWDMLGYIAGPRTATKNDKRPTGELFIIIDLPKRTLTLYSDGQPYKTYPVTIGKSDSQSPVGEWVIINKYKRTGKGPLGTRWMGLNVPWGVYGIHGTNKPWEIGMAASLGCIRLHNQYVEELFEWVPVGTRVIITGKRQPVEIDRILRPGQAGRQIQELQLYLRKRKFYSGYLDAEYGELTERAVKEIESQFGLSPDGIADFNVFYLLGIKGK